jgi:hypothetical protein
MWVAQQTDENEHDQIFGLNSFTYSFTLSYPHKIRYLLGDNGPKSLCSLWTCEPWGEKWGEKDRDVGPITSDQDVTVGKPLLLDSSSSSLCDEPHSPERHFHGSSVASVQATGTWDSIWDHPSPDNNGRKS